MNDATLYVRSHFSLPLNEHWREQTRQEMKNVKTNRQLRDFAVKLRRWCLLGLCEELGDYFAQATAEECDWEFLAGELLNSIKAESALAT